MFVPFPKIASRPKVDAREFKWDLFVKLHGTNAAIHVENGRCVAFQSRNRMITPEDDNKGFAAAMSTRPPRDERSTAGSYIIYGEWCGPGIQKGVAVANLPERQFFPFAVRDKETGLFLEQSQAILVVGLYGFLSTIMRPYQRLDGSQIKEWLPQLVAKVDAQCPLGEVYGIEGHGEGFVLRPQGEYENHPDYWWKAKGASHNTSTSTPAVFVPGDKDPRVSEAVLARLSQGVEYLREFGHPVEPSSIPVLIKWMLNDIQVEESIDDTKFLKMCGNETAKQFKIALANGDFDE